MSKIRWKTAQKFEMKWWEQYLKDKPVEEYLEWKKKYWLELMELLKPELQIKDSDLILDAGCGPAGIFIALDQNQVTAVDPLLNNYEKNLSHYSQDFYPYVTFENKRLEDIDDMEKYDIAFCMNAINHVQEIHESYIRLARSLKRGGWLVVTVDAHNFKAAKSIFRLLPGDILHPHQYDIKEYVDMIKQHGFRIEKRVFLKKEFWFNHYMILAQKI